MKSHHTVFVTALPCKISMILRAKILISDVTCTSRPKCNDNDSTVTGDVRNVVLLGGHRSGAINSESSHESRVNSATVSRAQ